MDNIAARRKGTNNIQNTTQKLNNCAT